MYGSLLKKDLIVIIFFHVRIKYFNAYKSGGNLYSRDTKKCPRIIIIKLSLFSEHSGYII